ncbi:MAG: NPCBM/NEW2 domain-containing protein [Verrucomicrobiales bacterium]|nr:NPCBM/NEW2 domain-containing protein [Verrucomicrobiales bacterium]
MRTIQLGSTRVGSNDRCHPDPQPASPTRWTSALAAIVLLLGSAADAFGATPYVVRLDALDLSLMRQGWGRPQTNRSMRLQPLSIAGKTFEYGVGTHAHSALWLDLAGGGRRFQAQVGVDDAAGGTASIQFRITGDGKVLFQTEILKAGSPAQAVDIDLTNVHTLLLEVLDGGNGVEFDHGNWAEARFLMAAEQAPRPIRRPGLDEPRIVLTPKPAPAPRINGPLVYGARPGNPFLYRIPTQGERPITFSATGLPDTLALDTASGIIRGTTPKRGEYAVTLRARNAKGSDARSFRIVSGDRLALTPPMGWNHWYTHYDRVTETLMRQAADVMVQSGMADVGYQYVNIDDCWMNAPKHSDPMRVGPGRDASGNLLPNRHFPDLKGLTDYIHSKGLKAGTYTSPGPLTCAGFTGAWQFEAQDARQFAAWGFDFLKYDWCSYGDIAKSSTDEERSKLIKPYALMGRLLREQPRDIVFNLCQYGMGNVWEWGAEVGGHCWRTAGDLGFELDRIFEVALRNAEHRAWSRPGEWNDPDYIQIGYIGAAHEMGQPVPCPLSASEQYAFMALWSLSAAPLFFSGDMGNLDAFTLGVLCNPEVIAIDQDPLGQGGQVRELSPETFLMVKDLADGTKAVGLFNRSYFPSKITATWEQLSLHGRQPVRDVWRQKDLGSHRHSFEATVPARGGVLVKIGKAAKMAR